MSKRERLAFNACSSLLMLENALLRSSMLPLAPFCSRTPCVHRRSFLDIPATALRSSSLLLATALCTLIVHSSSLIVAHPITSIVRSSTQKLENFLHLLVHMLMLENALRSSSHMLARALHSSFLSSLLTLARFVGSSHLS